MDYENRPLRSNEAEVLISGRDLVLISMSYGVIECLKIEKILNSVGIKASVINLRSVSPIDSNTILEEVKKTRRAVIFDTSHIHFGVASEISALIHENLLEHLLKPCMRIGNLFQPAPSAPFLAKKYYPDIRQVIEKIIIHFEFKTDLKLLEKILEETNKSLVRFGDQPDIGEVGPF